MANHYFRPRLLKTLCLLAVVLSSLCASAAKIVDRDMKLLPNDQTAINPATTKKDQNGKTYAVIKVYLNNLKADETFFEGGLQGLEKVNKDGQVWLYVPERSTKIKVLNQKYEPYDWYFTEEIKSGKTYSVILSPEGKEVILSASTRQAPIWVDSDSIGLSPVNHFLPYGEYYVKAQLDPMFGETQIIVSPEGPSRFEIPMENLDLKYSQVTITSPDNADIWFEGKKVGFGEYRTKLLTGDYTVTFRKEGYEERSETFHAQAGTPTNVKGPVLDPYRGYLSIVCNPTTGVEILSGDTLVSKHRLDDKRLLVGDHTYTFHKGGYIDLTKTFHVSRNEQTIDTVTLQRIQYIRPSTIYVGAGVAYGTGLGVGFHVGANYRNINAEFGYTLGLTKGDEVYWFEKTGDQLYVGKCAYAVDNIEFKLGYQLSFVQRIGLTPQLGYLGQKLRGGDWGSGAMCHNLSIGARVVFNPHPTIGIFANPEYAIPVSVNDLYKSINEFGGPAKGGFNVRAGVEFNFGI